MDFERLYSRLLIETHDNVSSSLDEVVNYSKSKGLDVQVYISRLYDNQIQLSHIQSPVNSSGLGTEFMNNLIQWADKHRFLITLSPAQSGDLKKKGFKHTSSKSRLEKFYKKFGFQFSKQQGRYDLSGSMFREPKLTN
jgi:GNAT superfamily N-acetyltransferase